MQWSQRRQYMYLGDHFIVFKTMPSDEVPVSIQANLSPDNITPIRENVPFRQFKLVPPLYNISEWTPIALPFPPEDNTTRNLHEQVMTTSFKRLNFRFQMFLNPNPYNTAPKVSDAANSLRYTSIHEGLMVCNLESHSCKSWKSEASEDRSK